MVDKLESPYPYFGGKSKVASLVWEILGNVDNYVEPFMGSAAILLGRPHEGRMETVNDFDSYVANFWRSVKYNSQAVAEHCDWPVNETDLIARQNWLVRQKEFRERMLREPFYFDPQIAGWWCWGLCNWVGGGYCVKEIEVKMPAILDRGILTDDRIANLYTIFTNLQKRLRLTHVACGDWSRVCSPTITYKRGLTGIVLDPPYGEGKMDYAVGGNKDSNVAKDVQKWAVENGDNPLLRIIYCGYEGQFNPPDSWTTLEWKAQGGYGGGKGTEADVNSYRERLWCSPHCLGKSQKTLFSQDAIGKAIVPVKVKNEQQSTIDKRTDIGSRASISESTLSKSAFGDNENKDRNQVVEDRVEGTIGNTETKEANSEQANVAKVEDPKPSEEVKVEKIEEVEIEICICNADEIVFECLVHNTELREAKLLEKQKQLEEKKLKEKEEKELKYKKFSAPGVQNKLF
jgi:DNA adenine methylase